MTILVFYIYVLKSLRNGKRYVGYTKKTPLERLKEHHSGSNKWTKQNGPFMLIYQEEIANSIQARQRERFLKSGQGRKWLDENVDY